MTLELARSLARHIDTDACSDMYRWLVVAATRSYNFSCQDVGLGSSIDSLAGVEGSDNWLAVAGLKLNIMCSYQPPLPLPASPS